MGETAHITVEEGSDEVTADGDGTSSLTFTIPAEATTGQYEIKPRSGQRPVRKCHLGGQLSLHDSWGNPQPPWRGGRGPREIDAVAALLEDFRATIQSQSDDFSATADRLEAIATPEARAGRLTALHG